MHTETKRALKGSIRKWKRIIEGTRKDNGMVNCPLCKIFYGLDDCAGCPVNEKKEQSYCEGTPYNKWAEHHVDIHTTTAFPRKIECEICERFAKQELKFLISLLP